MKIAWFSALSLTIAVEACQPREPESKANTSSVARPAIVDSPSDGRVHIDTRAKQVLAALKARDMEELACLVHPTKGVRFSPFAYVRADSDVVVTRDEIAGLLTSSRQYVWGYGDGSGEPLRFTFEEYYRRYVYNADFLSAPRVAYNSPPIRSGNTPSNIRAVYPGSMYVEHHFPGFDPKYEGMDWTSLWLVFEQEDATWYLVGVVHGSWTI